jgi:hypothetical protein
MPISWRGTLAQYVAGCTASTTPSEVIVYDYVDSGVPLLDRMALKRQTGYRSLGYEILTEVAPAMAAARTAARAEAHGRRTGKEPRCTIDNNQPGPGRKLGM